MPSRPGSDRSERTGSGGSRPSTAQALQGPLIALAVVVVLGIVAVVWGLGGGGGASRSGTVAEVHTERGATERRDFFETLVHRVPDDPLAMGDADAPVAMIMWSDFQCPFCGRFARETEPVLIDRFVGDGTLRLEWRDFPYLGEQSPLAAQAGRAAAEQDAFWAFQDTVCALGLPPNSGQLTTERLTGIAADLGLDVDRFTATMQSREVVDAVAADFAEGQALGITGTPAFLVNGRPIMGAQPTDVFVEAIEQAAEQARSDG